MGASGWVHLEVEEVVRETDKELLLRIEEDCAIWCPKSQIADADTYSAGDRNCTISVSEWWYEKEGLA